MRVYPELTVDGEFKALGDLGHSGSLNDRQFSFLRSRGYVNSLADMMTSWLSYSFSPINLFSASEPGIWLDPSDLTTLFTDTAGTTPVTTPGQTVALALDKSRGLVLGSELVTNGTFDTDVSGWTQIASGSFAWDASGGIACTDVAGADCNAQANITTVAGRTYLAEWTVRSVTGGGQWLFRIRNSTDYQRSEVGLTGTYRAYFVASVTGTNTVNLLSASTGQTVVFDNISVRELAGNHAVQATAASRPTYGVVPVGGRRNLLTYTEQFDNAAWAKTNATVTANAVVAPDGTTTAEGLVQAAGTRTLNVDGPTNEVALSGDKCLTVSAKQNTARYLAIGFSNGAGFTATAAFDLQTGTLSGSGFHPSVCTSITTSITAQGSGWYRCSIGLVGSANVTNFQHISSSTAPSSGIYGRDITGDGTSGILIWGAQLETGSTATAYQRVTTAFDVTEAGVQSVPYLFDDLVDDQINFTATAGTNYTVAWVDTAGNVTIQTAQSLSGTTDALRAQRMAGYLAINRALTAGETTNLTNWFKAKAGVAP